MVETRSVMPRYPRRYHHRHHHLLLLLWMLQLLHMRQLLQKLLSQ